MRTHVLALCSCLMLAVFAAPVAAQRTTGEIIGKVTDDSGGVLPGVTVTLCAPGRDGR